MLRRKQCWSDGAAQADPVDVNIGTAQPLPNSLQCHVRAHSLSDLDCLASSVPLFQRDREDGTSSSSDVLVRVAQIPQYPLLPCRSPEARSPTPPGLPSFGTGEAERLRLMPLTHMERLTRFLLQRLAGRDTPEQNDQLSQGISRSAPQNIAPIHRAASDEPAEMLRRMLGTMRPVAVPVKPVRPRRSGLPRGVMRSAYPGVLAQADDSTHIRGRFGARASGHGVGQRNIDSHPFAHRTNSSEIAAVVRDIDKACREVAQHDRDTFADQELHSPRHHENTSPRTASTTAMAIAESLTAIQAIEREQRALKALRDSKRENMRLKAALKALQRSAPPTAQSSKHTHNDSNTSKNLTARGFRQARSADEDRLETIIVTNPPLRGDSEQTIDDVDPMTSTEHPEMVEPLPYSSYSSYSYTPGGSGVSPLTFPNRARQALPNLENMIERQTEERRQATHDALNRCQLDEKSKCDHC